MHLENFSNIEFIGRGGFGTVYKGYSEVRKETVAIKKISKEDKSEADLMCHLSSMLKKEGKYRCFVEYYDQINKDGMCYIIMEYCKYGSLNDYVAKHGPMNLELLEARKSCLKTNYE
ncbi:protein kinase domain-containing protein [Ditylenchus destructor]|nr:protein kinase domain-containing protein [Ditylenchus destructor]